MQLENNVIVKISDVPVAVLKFNVTGHTKHSTFYTLHFNGDQKINVEIFVVVTQREAHAGDR